MKDVRPGHYGMLWDPLSGCGMWEFDRVNDEVRVKCNGGSGFVLMDVSTWREIVAALSVPAEASMLKERERGER